MSRKLNIQLGLVALTSAFLFGCQTHKMNMDEMMKPAERPAELDHLNMFIGTWEGTAEITMAGSDELMASKGKSTYEWSLDKWLLIERSEYEWGEGQTMHGMGYWWWDPDEKHFKMSWFDNDGGVGHGTARYDEKSKTWTMKAKSQNPYKPMKTIGEGTAKMLDDRTMEWSWEEEIPMLIGSRDFMKMKGTTHKH